MGEIWPWDVNTIALTANVTPAEGHAEGRSPSILQHSRRTCKCCKPSDVPQTLTNNSTASFFLHSSNSWTTSTHTITCTTDPLDGPQQPLDHHSEKMETWTTFCNTNSLHPLEKSRNLLRISPQKNHTASVCKLTLRNGKVSYIC